MAKKSKKPDPGKTATEGESLFKDKPLLESWAVRQVPYDDPYMAPELKNIVAGQALTGYVSGHPNCPDGPITTTRLMELDTKQRWARTKNTIYRLGKPDPEFVAWLKVEGHTLDEFDRWEE